MATTIATGNTNAPRKLGDPIDRGVMYTGKALYFDGVTDYIITDYFTEFRNNYFPADHKEATIAFWINTTDTGSSYIVDLGGRTYSTRPYVQFSDGKIRFRNNNAGSSSLQSTKTVNDGEWHRVVCVYNGGALGVGESANLRIYIDGERQTGFTTYTDATDTNDFGVYGLSRIGSNVQNGSFFEGSLCDVQLWNKAWGSAEVIYDYKNPERLITENADMTTAISAESNLASWYPMNDTPDRSGPHRLFDASKTTFEYKAMGTSYFYGDMTDLIADNSANGQVLYNTANTEYNFVEESSAAAAEGDGYDIAANSHWTTSNCTFLIETDNSSTGGQITNTASLVGTISSGQISTVAGRQYKFSVEHYPTSESFVDEDLGISIGTSAGGTQYVSTQNSDGSYDVTFTATTTTLHITLFPFGATSGNKVRLKSMYIREVGYATGWTDIDQQSTIPQTALLDGSIQLISPIVDTGAASPHYTLGSTGTTTSGTNYSISAWLMRTVTPGAQDNYLISSGANDRIYFPSGTQVGWVTDGTGTTITISGGGSDNQPKIDEWELWTFVSRSGTYYIYKNNVETATSSQSPSNGFDYNHIGVYAGVESTTGFEGIIGELIVWDSALTAADVTELYNGGAPLDGSDHSRASDMQYYFKNGHYDGAGKIKDFVGTNTAVVSNSSSFDTIYFQQGITNGKNGQLFPNNINQPHRGGAYFDGISSYIDCGSGDYIDDIFDGGGTIMIWVKLLSPTSNLYFASKGGNGNQGWQFGTDTHTSGKSHVLFMAQHASTDGKVLKNASLSLNTWTHYTVTYNSIAGNKPVLYKNGALVTSLDTDQTSSGDYVSDAAYQLDIGRKNTSDSGNWNGILDDFKIYNRILTTQEIYDEYEYSKSSHTNK